MSVTGIQSASQSNAAPATGLNSFTPDDFLNLLVTELRMQDPLSPMDTQALVQQLSQMQMVAETRQSRESQEFGQAVGLIGRTVNWENTETGLSGAGIVSGIARDGSSTTVLVDGQRLKLNQIVTVF